MRGGGRTRPPRNPQHRNSRVLDNIVELFAAILQWLTHRRKGSLTSGWWARKDLNLGPMDYESTALTAELRAHGRAMLLLFRAVRDGRNFATAADLDFQSSSDAIRAGRRRIRAG
jgi:hypothetical protein